MKYDIGAFAVIMPVKYEYLFDIIYNRSFFRPAGWNHGFCNNIWRISPSLFRQEENPAARLGDRFRYLRDFFGDGDACGIHSWIYQMKERRFARDFPQHTM